MEKTEAVKAPEKTKQTSKQRVLAALENAQKLVEQRKAALVCVAVECRLRGFVQESAPQRLELGGDGRRRAGLPGERVHR